MATLVQAIRSRRTVFGVLTLCAQLALGAAIPAFLMAQNGAPALGPRDGAGMASLDTGRVSIGTLAPDFTLEAKDGPAVTLSQFRGKKTVVLVFYRGHW